MVMVGFYNAIVRNAFASHAAEDIALRFIALSLVRRLTGMRRFSGSCHLTWLDGNGTLGKQWHRFMAKGTAP